MDSIFILTGAGISAESGLGTFRDKDGLWTRYDLRRVATPEGFRADPALVHDFYNMRRRNCLEATPNAAHEALARLQRQRPGRVTLVTQNVDDLHERAGSPEVIHMHGELLGALCAACGHRWHAPERMAADDPCPACARPATRPDIVWFGEIPYRMDEILERLSRATLFAVIGSSGEVYPAAGFVEEAAARGIATIEINLEPGSRRDLFDRGLHGPASETVPRWVEELLQA
ncbi:NAD-dependent deacylase [Cereibacter azotoformans]|uniref:NAD-dependent protein deacylase n=1 Tax=Cereibacter azotoformans TaxID=43057 RepID=A0A2T5KAB0_9RHOB|nr:NAD-dependent deacylase [Cereibacter azotoformans]AXQ95248.1 NAD-dependent deacylase [Cereibacter sphaeroides]PTR19329.1 NAD-dependent deacetylase [Cereibacter azotoformans]UIJ32535.1 NAD-dependent deacylase [Cereibacter azotoformans]